MKHHSSLFRALVRVAILMFALNATLAYGSGCCIVEMTHEASESMEMPCHEGVDQNQSTSVSNECCLVCVSMIRPLELVQVFAPAIFLPLNSFLTPPRFSRVDPPFRPPISILS